MKSNLACLLLRLLTPALLLAAFATPSLAQVSVTDAWVRGTVASQRATGAFMSLQSVGDAALVGAASPVAQVVEVHEMTHEGGVMKMRAVDRIPLPAGRKVELKPGGYHVMLMSLNAPIKEGDVVPITLTVEGKDGKRSSVEVKATARALTSPATGQHGGMKH